MREREREREREPPAGTCYRRFDLCIKYASSRANPLHERIAEKALQVRRLSSGALRILYTLAPEGSIFLYGFICLRVLRLI